MARRNQYKIWQWNCRGYRRKRGNLQQFLNGKEAPDVIALQETGGMAKLSYTNPMVPLMKKRP